MAYRPRAMNRASRTSPVAPGLRLALHLALVGAFAALLAGCPSEHKPGGSSGGGLPDGYVGTSDAATATNSDTISAGLVDGVGGDDGTSPVEDVVAPDGPACAKSTACKPYPDKPYCATAVSVCVECLIDFHCKDTTNHCEDFVCSELSCKPGATECKGDFLQTCNPDGKGYTATTCPDDKPQCVGGSCRLCEPGASYCAKPANPGDLSKAVLQCSNDGQKAQLVASCTGDQVCHAAQCGVCVPGAKQCNGHAAQYCAADGSAWVGFEDCSAKGLTCLGGICVSPCADDFKSNTNVGCDYWAVDLDNAVDGGGGKIYDAQNA